MPKINTSGIGFRARNYPVDQLRYSILNVSDFALVGGVTWRSPVILPADAIFDPLPDPSDTTQRLLIVNVLWQFDFRTLVSGSVSLKLFESLLSDAADVIPLARLGVMDACLPNGYAFAIPITPSGNPWSGYVLEINTDSPTTVDTSVTLHWWWAQLPSKGRR